MPFIRPKHGWVFESFFKTPKDDMMSIRSMMTAALAAATLTARCRGLLRVDAVCRSEEEVALLQRLA